MACRVIVLVFIEWWIDDRITVVMLNKMENEPPGVRRGAYRDLRVDSGILLYKVMRSCMAHS